MDTETDHHSQRRYVLIYAIVDVFQRRWQYRLVTVTTSIVTIILVRCTTYGGEPERVGDMQTL